MLKKDKSTPENREFWEYVEQTAKEVSETFPSWKRGDMQVGANEMSRDKQIELKDCPFCGGTARWSDGSCKQYGLEQVHCDSCMSMAPPDDDKEKAARWWNTRDREAVLVDALEAIATMPDYDQDNEHRLRNIADKALKEYRGER